MARDFKELHAKMDLALRSDYRRRVRAELQRIALDKLRCAVSSRFVESTNPLPAHYSRHVMDPPGAPPLKFLHSQSALNSVKLDVFRRLPTAELILSLAPGQRGSLKVRTDGTVLDGHHRLCVLTERGENIDQLSREIMEKES